MVNFHKGFVSMSTLGCIANCTVWMQISNMGHF